MPEAMPFFTPIFTVFLLNGQLNRRPACRAGQVLVKKSVPLFRSVPVLVVTQEATPSTAVTANTIRFAFMF